ncbi:SOUL heme-binding family protein [Perilla frutescens var. hirtella]|nr:SOUL heme-binding family protein [Perilla frutescens var. hirtella]
MESIYRLLLHEQKSLIEGDHKYGKLLSSVEHHRLDLATALETAKWQLEDFEREANSLAFVDKSQVKKNVITRHQQFIRAIREQIGLVEQSMNTSLGNSLRNMLLNEQDRNGLAVFLSGEKPTKHIANKELEDNDILRRFLDPTVSSSSREVNNGGKDGENMSFLDHNENSITKMDFGSSSSVEEANYGRYDEEGTWDLEASGPEARSYLQNNKLRDYSRRMNIFGSFGNFLSIYGRRASRNFIKRLKDGEEQMQSPIYRNSQHRMQRYLACLRPAFVVSTFHPLRAQISARALQSSNWIRDHREKCQRSFRNHRILFILPLLLTLLVLIKSMATADSTKRASVRVRTTSPLEARVSLVLALAAQTSSLSQRLLMDLATETAKYVFPNRRFESRTFEEALMSVPDLETVEFKVLKRNDRYEIREVESYFIAETTMPGKYGFDFAGASRSFNVLAEYLFGKNTKEKPMEMTTPVFTRRVKSQGEKMDMTTPVITRRVEDEDKWKMSFVLPSKYGANLPLPKDSSVTITEVPKRVVAVVAFSGFVTDDEIARRESTLRELLRKDTEYRVKDGASVEVAQYNPPFALPFNRRNEIALEVVEKQA